MVRTFLLTLLSMKLTRHNKTLSTDTGYVSENKYGFLEHWDFCPIILRVLSTTDIHQFNKMWSKEVERSETDRFIYWWVRLLTASKRSLLYMCVRAKENYLRYMVSVVPQSKSNGDCWCAIWHQGYLLLTWVNFIPSMGKQLYSLWSVEWNNLSIPKLRWWRRWRLELDRWFHHMQCWVYNYLSMLELKLIRIREKGIPVIWGLPAVLEFLKLIEFEYC